MKYIIDSFTTLTPLSAFLRLNPELKEEHIVLNTFTGEIKEEKRLPIYIDQNGIKSRISILVLFGKPHLKITFTSKMLKRNYLEGINKQNFGEVLSYVLKEINSFITLEQFINQSKINDIDIARDFLMEQNEFERKIKSLRSISGTKVFYSKPKIVTDLKRIVGITFVNRMDASIKTPFVKIYSKWDELNERSNEFQQNFGINVSENRRRIEGTLKNSTHIKSIAKKLDFLEEKWDIETILSFSEYELKNILDELLRAYTPEENIIVNRKRVDKKIKPIDALIIKLMDELLQNGYTFKQIQALRKEIDLEDTAKSRLKKKLTSLLEHTTSIKKESIRLTLSDAFLT